MSSMKELVVLIVIFVALMFLFSGDPDVFDVLRQRIVTDCQ